MSLDKFFEKQLEKSEEVKKIWLRFSDRPVISREECYQLYFEPLSCNKKGADELFDFIEWEFSVPVGMIRPNDELSKLIDPIPVDNMLKRFFQRFGESDRNSELWYELSKRLKKYESDDLWEYREIKTIGDFYRAWCGETPG